MSNWGQYLDISDFNLEITNEVDNTNIVHFMNKYVHKIPLEPNKICDTCNELDIYIDDDGDYLDDINLYNYISSLNYLKFNILKYVCFTINWLFIKN